MTGAGASDAHGCGCGSFSGTDSLMRCGVLGGTFLYSDRNQLARNGNK